LDPERLLRCPPPPVSPDDAALPAPDELLLSRPHWIRIASTSSLVQLEVRTGAEGTSTTGSCFGAAGGSCDPDDRFFFGSSPAAAASLADDPGLTTNTVALFAVAAASPAAALLGCCCGAGFLALSSETTTAIFPGLAGGFFLLKQRPMLVA
jgi:hypothetical protein